MSADEASAEATIARNPFLKLLGLRFEDAQAGTSKVTIEYDEHLVNVHGSYHGGVVMSLLDVALARAARSQLASPKSVLTINLNVTFIRPALNRLTAIGRTIGGGRSICLCEGEVRDINNELVAKALGSFKYV